jgi:hypothetical protein
MFWVSMLPAVREPPTLRPGAPSPGEGRRARPPLTRRRRGTPPSSPAVIRSSTRAEDPPDFRAGSGVRARSGPAPELRPSQPTAAAPFKRPQPPTCRVLPRGRRLRLGRQLRREAGEGFHRRVHGAALDFCAPTSPDWPPRLGRRPRRKFRRAAIDLCGHGAQISPA